MVFRVTSLCAVEGKSRRYNSINVFGDKKYLLAIILLHRLVNYWHDFVVLFAFIRSTIPVPLDNLFVFDDS
jgi:hypothetical protein